MRRIKREFYLRLLSDQTLTVTFKKPASLLAETVLDVQRTNELSSQCSRWWCFLNLARKFFDENPVF
jgi:hypothetical protein